MAVIPSRDWNPFLTAGRALAGLQGRAQAQAKAETAARGMQQTASQKTAQRAGGILTVHFEGAQTAAGRQGGKVEVGMPYPAKPKPFKGGTVQRNPQTQKVEANPEYQKAKSRVEHFNEVVAMNVGNPHIIPRYVKPTTVFGD